MNFTRIGQWAEVSEDQRYTVAMIQTAGKFSFEAYFRNGKKLDKLGAFSDAGNARAACDNHAKVAA